MKKYMLLGALCVLILSVKAQKRTETKLETYTVGHLLDSAYKKNNMYVEFDFGKAGGVFSPPLGSYGPRSIVMNIETGFKAGFFPVKKLLIGWDFSPQFSISDKGMEGFRWSTGPFIRYYFPFYRITKTNELKSPFALYLFLNYRFGQYNPLVLDRPFDKRFTTGFSLGIGFQFKLKKNLLLHIESGLGYDFYASEFSNSNISTVFRIGLSYSFSTKKERAEKKYRSIIK